MRCWKGVNMIEIESYKVCMIDNKPIGESQAYKVLVDEIGEERAARWTYDYIVKEGSAELRQVAEIITGGVPPAIYRKGESA